MARSHPFFYSLRAFTVVELLIVTAIISLILFVVLPLFFIPGVLSWIEGQSVTDADPVAFLTDQGKTDVYTIESFRWDPEDDVGCVPADKAGFKMHVSGDDYSLGEVWLCCNGDFATLGKASCREVPSP